MARKPGKPIRSKRLAKRVRKAAVDSRRSPIVALPIVDDDAALTDIDAEAGAALDVDAPIEVSEFHPIESTPGNAADGEEPLEGAPLPAGAVVPVDPLSRYLAEIRRFPLLTREEEKVISRRYIKERDPADAYRLVTANLRLVVKIAFEFARATRNALDLIQEGNIGLMEAVKNFDPEHGVRFPSYAVWWVRAYIYRYLINNSRLVKIGTTQAQRKLFFNLRKESERLEGEGFSRSRTCWRIGWASRRAKCARCRNGWVRARSRSISRPARGGHPAARCDPRRRAQSGNETADREWHDFAQDKVRQFADTLEGKELEIFNARLLAEDPDTLQEIGVKFGISRERVRQIETRLKRRLKEFIEAAAPDVDDAGPS